MLNDSDEPLSVLISNLAAMGAQERFYLLRFMWVTISAFESMGLHGPRLREMRGLYQGLADDVAFSDHIDQQKGADPKGQPQS